MKKYTEHDHRAMYLGYKLLEAKVLSDEELEMCRAAIAQTEHFKTKYLEAEVAAEEIAMIIKGQK